MQNFVPLHTRCVGDTLSLEDAIGDNVFQGREQATYLQTETRHEDCQFIIATHSRPPLP